MPSGLRAAQLTQLIATLRKSVYLQGFDLGLPCFPDAFRTPSRSEMSRSSPPSDAAKWLPRSARDAHTGDAGQVRSRLYF
jgi:hypothetical protein